MTFIGQGPEHSIDMEMVDLSTYVPHLSNVLPNNNFIHHSGRIMVTYSGPMIMERPFTLVQYPDLISRLLCWTYFELAV